MFLALFFLIAFTILIVKNDNLLRKPTYQQIQMGQKLSISFYIIEAFYKAIGHFLILLTHVLLVPAFIVISEIERCSKSVGPSGQQDNFICKDSEHQTALGMGILGTICAVLLSLFQCLFVNSQFPSKPISRLPCAIWDPKARAYLVLWKVIYCFHYDIFDPKYLVAFRIAAFYVFYQILQIKLAQPRIYDEVLHIIELFFYSGIPIIHGIVVIQDIGILDMNSFSRELLPILIILNLLAFAILIVREKYRSNEMIARDNQDLDLFEEETDMELYINILLEQLSILEIGENLNGISADQYASSPHIFTIISRHMENCSNEDCICKRYEPEFDRKFSTFAMTSRRFTKRQSSSMTNSFVGSGDASSIRKKIPIKISFDSKCQIFKAELADCLERFLQAPQCRSGSGGAGGVGLKLQKSYFYHAYMNSSYKALFVQLENSITCNTFRGKIYIYHLKTRIQEEMIQSESSPLSSLDITTCLKFESQRLFFEQRIIDLCLACEAFWTELINKSAIQQSSKKNQKTTETIQQQQEFGFSMDDFDDDDDYFINEEAIKGQNFADVLNDDYNVSKMNDTLLEIAATIIDVKKLFSQLCMINPQSVAVLQSYVLVYRYILRDEYRFEEIVRTLGQLYRTNKLEQLRDQNPMFCDSDNFSMLVVSGDMKDLGRILRVNRGVDQLLGYSPEELQGSKINKIMPHLYSLMHDKFLEDFLKRGFSNFVSSNQFIPAQNKLGLIAYALVYVKVLVDLKIGLLFVAFIKAPHKIPMTYEPRDGGCKPSQGALFVKASDAYFILCDGNGTITSISQNCMRALGLPPTLIMRSNSSSSYSPVDSGNAKVVGGKPNDQPSQTFNSGQPVNINQFCPGIMNPEYEFDLAKGMNYIFDSSFLKLDKALAREFPEIKNRMCRYNISVTLRRAEYKLKYSVAKTNSQILTHDILLFTILINSYSFTDTPNIVIPVFRDDDDQVGPMMIPILNLQSSQSTDEMRTSKFKEFKAQVQELELPSKVSKLRKITIAFFLFLLSIFSLNYGLCVSQDKEFTGRVEIQSILYELTERVPSTARYTRTAINIANGEEPLVNEELQGKEEWESRYQYYMRRIAENAESFRLIQQEIYTQFRDKEIFSKNKQVILKDLQTDFSIKQINSTLLSSLNLYLSKALQISKLSKRDLQNKTVPFQDSSFNPNNLRGMSVNQIQQDLYFLLENGQNSILETLLGMHSINNELVHKETGISSTLTLSIAVASMLAILLVVVPLVYPLLTHYEILAEIVLHALNKLTRDFVEKEVKCCNQLYDYISHKTESESATKAAEKRENDENYNDAIKSIGKQQTRKRLEPTKQQNAGQIPKNNNEEESQFQDQNNNVVAMKWSLSFEEEKTDLRLKKKDTLQPLTFKKYQKRGHMPPLIRRASFYERAKDTMMIEFDSFREDDTQSNGSSQSNYSHQDFFTQQVLAIKQMGLLDPDKDDNGGLLNIFELSQAKSSEIPPEPIYMRDLVEDRKQKMIVSKRKLSIQQAMKKSRCRKLVSVCLFVLSISIYLAINTMYTSLVYALEKQLQDNMRIIDTRMLCYPYSIVVLKELVFGYRPAEAKSIQSHQRDRYKIEQCYKSEQEFQDLILGKSPASANLNQLTTQYKKITQSLGKDQFCSTLKSKMHMNNLGIRQDQALSYVDAFCPSSQHGLTSLGLHETLNYLLRDQDKLLLDLDYSSPTMIDTENDLLPSQETVLDLFLAPALHLQRETLFGDIETFAKYLFGIFDILFAVFLAALCLATAFVGFVYINRRLQRRIVQIYQIVMLIPYGERTKRELNELIKIAL